MRRRDVMATAAALMLPGVAGAQVAGDEAVFKAIVPALTKQGRYGPLLAEVLRQGDVGVDTVGQSWALLGDEARAMTAWEKRRLRRPSDTKLATATPEVGAFIDAVEAIATSAHGRRVVIINEDHNRSRHRAFTGILAARLRRDGFTLFAAETFSPATAKLRAGDPVTVHAGYYTNDPVYAETVREVLALGYTLVPYERQQEQPALPGEDGLAPRERIQAENLFAALKANPEARVLVHSGEGHGNRTMFGPGVKSFGLQVNALLGAEALMVDQPSNSPRLNPANDGSLLRAAETQEAFQAPVCARSPQGRWMTGRLADEIDLAVISPRLAPRFGRPGWLFDRPGRQAVSVDLPSRADPWALVQAVPLSELAASSLTIPADQYPVQAAMLRATLCLKPGKYRLRLETPADRTDVRDLIV